jgi:hypothetical protein
MKYILSVLAVTAMLGLNLNAADEKKPEKKYSPGSCCEKAHKAGKACEHKCCVEAEKKNEVCAKCNKS